MTFKIQGKRVAIAPEMLLDILRNPSRPRTVSEGIPEDAKLTGIIERDGVFYMILESPSFPEVEVNGCCAQHARYKYPDLLVLWTNDPDNDLTSLDTDEFGNHYQEP